MAAGGHGAGASAMRVRAERPRGRGKAGCRRAAHPEVLSGLLMAVVDAVDARPRGPRVALRALVGRAWEELEVGDRLGAVAQRGADAVGPRVPAADDDDVLAAGIDEGAVVLGGEDGLLVGGVGEEPLLVLRQELHREHDPVEVAPWDRQVVWHRRADRQHGGVEAGERVARVGADVDAAGELDALRLHQSHPPRHRLLVQLHVRDPVREQPARLGGALEDRHRVAVHLVELVGGREAGRARADDGDLLARARARRRRHHPPRLPRRVDDVVLHVLDRHGVVDQARDARALARRGADAAGELGEVVGRREVDVRLLPLLRVHQVVELGDQVVDWAASVRLAEGRAAVHAARGLALELERLVLRVDLEVVRLALRRRPVRLRVALVLDEAAQLVDRRRRAVAPLDDGRAEGAAQLARRRPEQVEAQQLCGRPQPPLRSRVTRNRTTTHQRRHVCRSRTPPPKCALSPKRSSAAPALMRYEPRTVELVDEIKQNSPSGLEVSGPIRFDTP